MFQGPPGVHFAHEAGELVFKVLPESKCGRAGVQCRYPQLTEDYRDDISGQ
jgi:hypothetical protein